MTKLILSIAVAAVIAVSMIMTPALAFTAATSAEIGHNKKKNTDAFEVTTADAIPTDGSGGAFGYGAFTLDQSGLAGDQVRVVVLTTHAGADDSNTQSGPSDPVWHSHGAVLQVPAASSSSVGDCNAGDARVVSATLAEVGKSNVQGNSAEVGKIDSTSVWALNKSGGVVAFDLYLQGADVCVTNITPIPTE